MSKIIGNGDIANALNEIKGDFLFFASGVSNSQETRDFKYEREIILLMNQDRNFHIVYFSSLAIFYSDTRYTKHKLQMEHLVKKFFNSYTIIRLGNITWGKNPHTLINYLRNKKQNGEPLEIQDTCRYLIDKEEFKHWMDMIPSWNCEMNIPGRRMSIKQIVEEYV